MTEPTVTPRIPLVAVVLSLLAIGLVVLSFLLT